MRSRRPRPAIRRTCHPDDENVTVISGTFNIGMGDKLDQAKSQAVKVGGYAHVPKGMQHFAWFGEDSVIQVHGMGPSAIRQSRRRSAQGVHRTAMTINPLRVPDHVRDSAIGSFRPSVLRGARLAVRPPDNPRVNDELQLRWTRQWSSRKSRIWQA
jgi:hypothetical protein